MLHVTGIFATGKVMVMILSLIEKFFVSAAWQIIWIWGVEVYPTSHRCMLTNISGVVGRVGSILALYIVDLVSRYMQLTH